MKKINLIEELLRLFHRKPATTTLWIRWGTQLHSLEHRRKVARCWNKGRNRQAAGLAWDMVFVTGREINSNRELWQRVAKRRLASEGGGDTWLREREFYNPKWPPIFFREKFLYTSLSLNCSPWINPMAQIICLLIKQAFHLSISFHLDWWHVKLDGQDLGYLHV